MSYGLNVNLVRKWRCLAGHDGEPAGSSPFSPCVGGHRGATLRAAAVYRAGAAARPGTCAGSSANGERSFLRRLAVRDAALIRVDALWLAVEPLDMRAGTEAALRRAIAVFGAARPHHAYLFANRRSNRMKVLVHDGIGVWLAARRLNAGRFVWPRDVTGTLSLSRTQFAVLVLCLPWRQVGDARVITLL